MHVKFGDLLQNHVYITHDLLIKHTIGVIIIEEM